MDSQLPTDRFVVGEHSAQFEPPDIVHLRPRGDVSVEDTLKLIKFVRTLPRPPKGFFGLVDIAHAKRQDPAVWNMPESQEFMKSYRAQVFYNATFYHRTLIGIFSRVGKLLPGGANLTPIMIFSTEAESRAWIAKHRGESTKGT